jgi:hypothetical protein
VRRLLIDDQLLGEVLRGRRPRSLARAEMFTTGLWYLRLCQAVLSSRGVGGRLSGPFDALPGNLRQRAVGALLQLPDEIGVLSLRDLGPRMAQLRQHHQLNLLGIEALAAAAVLQAEVRLSVTSPKLETALAAEGRGVRVVGDSVRGGGQPSA